MKVVQRMKIPESAPYVTGVVRPQGLSRVITIRQRNWNDFPIGSKVLVMKIAEPHKVDMIYYEGLKGYYEQKVVQDEYLNRRELKRKELFDNLVQKPVEEPKKEDSSETSNKN